MISPKEYIQEGERLKSLESYSILDSLPEADFDNLTAIASEICDTPISLVTLIDNKRQWFKSHHGLDSNETPKEHAFCAHAINDPHNILIVQDTSKDERFHDNPLVTGAPHIMFYAGVPLISETGMPLGTLCVIDNKPKLLTQNQIRSLTALSIQVMNLLELRKKKILLKQSFLKLEEKNKELEGALQRVSDYKKALDLTSIVAITDPKGDIEYVNQKFCQISQYSESELLGKNQRIVNSEYHTKAFWNEMWASLKKGNVWQNIIRNKAKDGSYYWVDVTIVPFMDRNNEPYQYLSIRKDITQQKQIEQKMINTIIFSQEQDREYFAEDLHEGLAQTLVSLTFQLQAMEKKINEGHDDGLKKSISSIKEYIRQSTENTKKIAIELMPRLMMEFGLIPSIESFIYQINATPDFDIDLYTDITDGKINKNIEITIYRALVAIIKNAMSSSDVKEIMVELNDHAGLLTKIELSGEPHFIDEGGIKKDYPELIGIQKRIELVGGRIVIDKDVKKGWTIISIKFEP